mmetsp:Transcript_7729/g.11647  ORF Transcript_7729/g.11647 Transcript_7729/m.11647 type:complete len:508 (+) Transcript_7729:10-1533(+)
MRHLLLIFALYFVPVITLNQNPHVDVKVSDIKSIVGSNASNAEKIILIDEIVRNVDPHEDLSNDHYSTSNEGFAENLASSCEEPVLTSSEIIYNVVMCLFLITCASIAAGLTMGLVSIDPLEMKIKLRSECEIDREYATKIYPLITKHHQLLVTLLLFNSLAFEALPIFLENIFSPFVSVVLSVTLILFVGEILPSAIFTGPNQLRIAATFSPLVLVLMIIFFPIAYPVGILLDHLLGHEGIRQYTRDEIGTLVEIQHSIRHASSYMKQSSNGRMKKYDLPLHQDEVTIMKGLLDTGTDAVKTQYIPLKDVYMLDFKAILNKETLKDILAAGFSRVPVYKDFRYNIVGYLHVKKLIIVNPEDEIPLERVELREPEVTSPNTNLLKLLNTFQVGRSHIAVVANDPVNYKKWRKNEDGLTKLGQPIGIITLEDILEEILKEEIDDEEDHDHKLLKLFKKSQTKFGGSSRAKSFALIHPSLSHKSENYAEPTEETHLFSTDDIDAKRSSI